jgi:hypothetical protein
MLSDKRKVERANQWQPVFRAIAKCGHFAQWIDDWNGGEGKERSRGSEARGNDARLNVSCSDGSHHVVTAAGADRRCLGKTPFPAEFLAQGSVRKL